MKLAALTATALAFLITFGCAATAETVADTKSAMTKSMDGDPIAQAKASFEAASKAGCAWRDTKKMIKQAEKLAAEGNTDKAHKLAAMADRQSQNGLKQCESEAKRLGSS